MEATTVAPAGAILSLVLDGGEVVEGFAWEGYWWSFGPRGEVHVVEPVEWRPRALPARRPAPEGVGVDHGIGAPWHIVETEPQRESTVAAALLGQRFPVYAPTRPVMQPTGRGRRCRTVRRPLFPGYVFVRFDAGVDPWWRVRSAVGVRHVMQRSGIVEVRRDADLAAIPEAAIEVIRRQEAALYDPASVKRPPKEFRVGKVARIVDGPFGGLHGVLDQVDDRTRIRVLLDLLGRQTPMVLPAEALAVID